MLWVVGGKDCLLQKVKFALSAVVSQYAPLSLLILGLQVCVAVGPGESSGRLRVIRDCTSTGGNGPLFFPLGVQVFILVAALFFVF